MVKLDKDNGLVYVDHAFAEEVEMTLVGFNCALDALVALGALEFARDDDVDSYYVLEETGYGVAYGCRVHLL